VPEEGVEGLQIASQGVGDNQGVVGQECQRGGGGGRLISDLEWREDCLLFCRGE